jgi:hypothetical protein
MSGVCTYRTVPPHPSLRSFTQRIIIRCVNDRREEGGGTVRYVHTPLIPPTPGPPHTLPPHPPHHPQPRAITAESASGIRRGPQSLSILLQPRGIMEAAVVAAVNGGGADALWEDRGVLCASAGMTVHTPCMLEHCLAPLGLWIPLPSATPSVRVASLNLPPFVMQGHVLTCALFVETNIFGCRAHVGQGNVGLARSPK